MRLHKIEDLLADPLRAVQQALYGQGDVHPAIAEALAAATLSNARQPEILAKGLLVRLLTSFQQLGHANMALGLARTELEDEATLRAVDIARANLAKAMELALTETVRLRADSEAATPEGLRRPIGQITSLDSEVLYVLNGIPTGLSRPELFAKCTMAETPSELAGALHRLRATAEVIELGGMYYLNLQLRKAA